VRGPATTEGRALAAIATDDFGGFYDERRAATDLKRYHEKGPQPWTKALIESLKAEAVEDATLLDVGGGVGVIAQELLDAGAASATCVEASAPYVATATAEASAWDTASGRRTGTATS